MESNFFIKKYGNSDITDENVGVFSNYLFRNINHRITAVIHIGTAFKSFSKIKLIQNIDNIIVNYLDSVGEYLNTNENDYEKEKPTVWEFWEKSEINLIFKYPVTKKNKILFDAVKTIFEEIFEALEHFCKHENHVYFLKGEYLKQVIAKRKKHNEPVEKKLE